MTVDVTARARSGGTAPPRTRRRLWSGAIRMSASVHDGTAGRIFASVGLLSLILAGAVCLLPIMPPLQDFNEWIYQGFLLKTLWLGGAVPAVVKPWPVPNSAAQVILGLQGLYAGKDRTVPEHGDRWHQRQRAHRRFTGWVSGSISSSPSWPSLRSYYSARGAWLSAGQVPRC